MKTKRKLNETAASGAVSAHSVAVRHDGADIPMQKRDVGFLDFLTKNNKKYANSFQMKLVEKPFKMTINEDVSLDQMFSKLSGIENSSRELDNNTTTYGVEDDAGNLMKITIKKDQAQDFEVALAQELAEVEHYKMTGRGGEGRDISMAEVLFNLKKKFDIIDVEFPEIPSDKVYNADKVSDPDSLDFDDNMDADLEDDEFGDGLENEGELGDDDLPPDNDFDADLDADSDGLDDDDEDELDVGEEFTEQPDDEESMLKQIIRMLSAEAEARKAQYEAEAEKSREAQAEYAAKTAKQEVLKQEDLLRMEEEQKRQKEKEKEAKQLADLAKYRLRGVQEEEGLTFKSALVMLQELGDLEDEVSIRMQRRNINDVEDPRERQMHSQILNIKRRLAQSREKKEREEDKQNERDARTPENNNRQQNNQQPAQNQQNNNPMQPVPNRRPIGGSNVGGPQ